MNQSKTHSVFGESIEFKTIEDSPSSIQNLSAIVLSPTEVLVSWVEPEEKFSDDLIYELHWTSQQYSHGNKISKQMIIRDGSTNIKLIDMKPGFEYEVWVVSKSGQNEIFRNSSILDKKEIKMFPSPNSIIVTSGARQMNISWKSPGSRFISQHYIQYYPYLSDKSEINKTELKVRKVTEYNEDFHYTVKDLSPGNRISTLYQ